MSGEGPDLDISKLALDEIARGITETLGELKELGAIGSASMGGNFSTLKLSGLETGHDGLTSTLGVFCERWGWGVRSLVQKGNKFAADVGLSAGLMHEQDQYIQDSFKVLTNAAMGNPYASEADVIGEDWRGVLSENLYTHFRDADYSRESFETAWDDSKNVWRETYSDVAAPTHWSNPKDIAEDPGAERGDP
ncbi:hypothetical protein ACIGJO_15380 [Streptomyces sp. NPDC079020]|uniref:hypothetical protein n=1 Tax=Streptomyces sp. NPDC079020 TaxID=3365722 RepID=UPI0037D6C697